MQPFDSLDLAVILLVPVVILRIVVGLSRPRRTSRFWTFGLPTFALLMLAVRVSITRNVDDLVGSDDPIAAASWWGITATQATATIYQWIPEVLYEMITRRVTACRVRAWRAVRALLRVE